MATMQNHSAWNLEMIYTPMAPSYLHSWEPDGSTLVYCAQRNGDYVVYAIPVEGGEEIRLTDAPGLDDGSEFSPYGKSIWFNSVRTNLMQVWRIKADGSEQTKMTFDPNRNILGNIQNTGTTPEMPFVAQKKKAIRLSAFIDAGSFGTANGISYAGLGSVLT